VRAVDYRSEPLGIGERYLLFLKSVPATGAYQSINNSLYEDSFRLTGDRLTQVSEKPLPFGSKQTPAAPSFIADLRAAVLIPCND
jgi:hypothetical protein